MSGSPRLWHVRSGPSSSTDCAVGACAGGYVNRPGDAARITRSAVSNPATPAPRTTIGRGGARSWRASATMRRCGHAIRPCSSVCARSGSTGRKTGREEDRNKILR